MTSPSVNHSAKDHSELPILNVNQRLCKRCSEFERQTLGAHLANMLDFHFDHYIYFNQICTAAGLGCQLCQVLEQGIMHARVKRLIGPPGSVLPIHSIEDARTYLLQQDSVLAALHKNGEWKKEQRYRINLYRDRFVDPSSNELSTLWQGFSSFRVLRYSGTSDSAMEVEYAKFMLCVSKEDSAFLQGRFCGREILPSFDVSLAKEWLSTCLSSHKCQTLIETSQITVPRRLIQVIQRGESVRARLISPTENQNLAYIALSYRWSEGTDHVSTGRTLPTYTESIPLEILPAAIRDAILLTAKMDLQYLWVDSLCIAQDSKKEWEEECTKMASIYANAIFTLAHAGSDPSSGFLRSGPSYPYPNSCLLNYCDNKGLPIGKLKVRYVHADGYVGSNTHTEPWRGSSLDTRGWTLQERLLSTRVLTFDNDKMWWECYSGRMIESLHMRPVGDVDPRALIKRPLFGQQPEFIYRWWYNALISFNARKLTFPMDRLPAISGIAKVVQLLTGDVYLAGLWANDLPRGLVWSSDLNYNLTDANLKNTQNSYRGPSWSWARSGIHIARPINVLTSGEELQSFITFVSADIKVESQNPFGHVSPNCILTIEAPARPTKLSKLLEKDLQKDWLQRTIYKDWLERLPSEDLVRRLPSEDWALGSHRDGSYNPRLRATLDDTSLLDDSYDNVECTEFLAIRISTFRSLSGDNSNPYGLILQKVDNGYYRRVAIFTLSAHLRIRHDVTDMDHFFADANIITISII